VLKQREGGRIVSVAAIIAVALNTEGKREIVGLHIGPSEAEAFWSGFLKSLSRRGLRGVKLVISDAHEGLKAAIRRAFGVTWQRCQPCPTWREPSKAWWRLHFARPLSSRIGRRPARRCVIGRSAATEMAEAPAFIDDSETDVLSHLDFLE
jgi:hypothetical protein